MLIPIDLETSILEREQDELDRAIERRRWVYRYGLFAKVCTTLLDIPLIILTISLRLLVLTTLF